MEQTKNFYESSTKQLVNILECLSTQLKTSNTHRCSSTDNGDSDSFDSLLSHSQLRPSQDSGNVAVAESPFGEDGGVAERNFPEYENVFYASPAPDKLTSPDSVIFKMPGVTRASDPVLPPKMSRRCDSVSSVLVSAPTQVIRQTPAQPRETGTRNKLVHQFTQT